jgi:hypothetical protein
MQGENMRKFKNKFLVLGLVLVSSVSFAGGDSKGSGKTIVKDVPSFYRAQAEACDGKSVGANCTIEFQGGSVSVGFCVEIPGPAGVTLGCQIDTSKLQNCKNNSTGTPANTAVFASVLALMAGGAFWRRRQLANKAV